MKMHYDDEFMVAWLEEEMLDVAEQDIWGASQTNIIPKVTCDKRIRTDLL